MDLVAGAERGREVALLERLLAAGGASPRATAPAAQSLAAAVMRSRDPAAVERLLALAGQASRPRWQRLALLTGANVRATNRGFGGFEGGPPPSFAAGPVAGGSRAGATGAEAPPEVPPRRAGGQPLALPNAPHGLVAALASPDSAVRSQAKAVSDALTWPGKAGAAAAPVARPLTPAERERYAAGQQQYTGSCAGCHQTGGTGLAGVAKPLVGSPFVLGLPQRLIRIVQHGKEGQMLMPPVGASLTDDQVAAVLTYIRRSWGNTADPITPEQVHEVRAETSGRKTPWTEAELGRIRR